MKQYDAIILGFGKGGKTLAGALAKQGQQVALVEKSTGMYGGTCINVGCIPSKSLVTSAAAAARHPEAPFAEKAAHYAAAVAEKRRVTTMLRGKNYHKLADLPNVTVLDGEGSFVSPTVVAVKTGSGVEEITADKIFIDTGAEPITPAIPGLAGNPKAYTSESLMDEDTLPARLTLVGAGYIGMEFASMYASFGSTVTVLQDGDTFLPREDRDVAEEIKKLLEAQGVRFVLGAKVERLDGGSVTFTTGEDRHTLEGDAVLIATGRRPATAALNAQNAGVSLTPRGAVQVDALLRTTAPGIWAMGDVAGGLQFTYVSLDDYRIVSAQLAGKAGHTTANRAGDAATEPNVNNVPYSVFMATPLSRAGISEEDAKRQGLAYRVAKLPTAAIPKAQVLGQTGGFLKAIVDVKTNRLLGAALLCPESYEMINLLSLAIDTGLDVGVLRDRIYTHPTMSEAFNDLFAL
ncbi:MAG: FAD-dependent oxidoreductase [Gemmiger sp.]|nr:FAD-dependent oxidoreductase [Gemmiger sp.]